LKLQVKIYHKLVYKRHVCYAVMFTGALRLWKTLKLEKDKGHPISLTCHEGTDRIRDCICLSLECSSLNLCFKSAYVAFYIRRTLPYLRAQKVD